VIVAVRIWLTVAGWGSRTIALGVIFGALFLVLSILFNIKFHLYHQNARSLFEFSFIESIIILCLIVFLRLAVFDRSGVDYYWPIAVFTIVALLLMSLITILLNYARQRGGALTLRTEKLFWVITIIMGLLFANGSIWRWRVMAKVLSGAPLFSSAEQAHPGQPKMPNVILIVLDTVRADHLSLYGYERQTTPFLESLGKNSVVFDRAYSTAPNTIPSHAGIFTGLYSSQNNCHFENTKLDSRFPVIADYLNKLGYFTYGMTNNGSLNHFNGFSRGFDLYEIFYNKGNFTGDTIWFWAVARLFPEVQRASGARVTEYKVKEFLKSVKNSSSPFFLFINYMEAHQPYPTTTEAFRFFDDPELAASELSRKSLDWDYFMCISGISDMTRSSAIKWYDGSIYYLDTKLSKIYEQLKNQDMLDNTIIIVTSDHGEGFGEHGIFGHMIGLYENNLHVPLLIHWSGHLKPKRISRVTSLRELPEMIKTLIQGKKPVQFREACPNCEIYAENFRPLYYIARLKSKCVSGKDLSMIDRRQKALINSDYKLIWDSRGDNQFFSLSDDPLEKQNLIGRNIPALEIMKTKMDLFIVGGISPNVASVHVDRETAEALKAIGYMR